MSVRPYRVPASSVEVEYVVKKSRFIARAGCVQARDQAMDFLQCARTDYTDARHHCWAYTIGPPHSPATAAMSDDGEPSGTAGKPILNVLNHKSIGDIMVVVIRYFGGIKLGAGGLVRAYGTSAQMAIDALPVMERRQLLGCCVALGFSAEQPLRHWLDTHNGRICQVQYRTGAVCDVEIEHDDKKALYAFVNALGGEIID